MKRLLVLYIALLWACIASAQKPVNVLREVSDAVAGLGAYTADFMMSSNDGEGQGSYTVSGEQFRINTGALELLCDGKLYYEIDHINHEVVIDKIGQNATIWSNPAKAFSMLEKRFNHSLEQQGREYILTLTPKIKGEEGFTLVVDSSTKLPMRAKYGVGPHLVTLRFVGLREVGNSPLQFTFDKEQYPQYEIIDMR